MNKSIHKLIYNILYGAFVFCFVLLCNNSFGQDRVAAIKGSISNAALSNGVIPPSTDVQLIPVTERDNSGETVLAPPPANDNCSTGLSGANTLTTNAPCKNGTLAAGTTEAGETLGCGSGTRTVWYSFTATQANMFVTLTQTGNPFICANNYSIRVYQYAGVCPPATGSAVGCQGPTAYGAGPGTALFQNLNLTGLTIGATYMVQVIVNAGCTIYPFCIAVGAPMSCSSCSNVCGPMCAYNSVAIPPTNTIVSTCPIYPDLPPMNYGDCRGPLCWIFTAPNTSAQTQSIIEGYGCGVGNVLSSTFSLYNTTCGAAIQTGNVIGGVLAPLIAGHQYVLCYTWCAACPEDTIWPFVWAPSALPIELLAFDAKANKRDIDVYWTTASEINTSHFIVERTSNGQDFIEVGTMKAAGNSTSIINYKIKDLKPLEGNNYYRLKEVDYDGKTTSGKLVSARFDRMETDIAVIPNPANDLINIRFSSDKDTPVQVYVIDTKGSIVLSKNVTADSDGVNFINVSISNLSKGVYSVHIVSSEQNLNTRFIKQ